jgi:DNA-binding GntR family transcriptional regulator
LETYAVKQAIAYAEPDDFSKLEKKLVAHESYTPHYYDRKKILLDAQFHLQIAETARNRILKWHLKTNLEHVYLRANLEKYDVSRMSITPNEHRRLLSRMRLKDTIASVELIRLHIQKARDHVIACLSDNELKDEEYHL